MNKREFLRSQGFTVGERGRFSADMLAAIAAAPKGVITEEGKVAKPKPPKVKVVKEKETQVSVSPKSFPKIPALPQVREDKVLWAVSPNVNTGSHAAIAYSLCHRCTHGVRFCACKAGPKPPAGAIPVRSFAEAKAL